MKGQENLQKGKDFLAANKTKEGIVELESGLQYKIITNGEGPKPSVYDNVVCHYEGSLIDGTVFDSSEAHGNEPLTFQLGTPGIIAGFQIGINGMKEGGERVMVIPPSFGYGTEDVKDADGKVIIPANSTLVFGVKLLKVEPAPAASPSTPSAE